MSLSNSPPRIWHRSDYRIGLLGCERSLSWLSLLEGIEGGRCGVLSCELKVKWVAVGCSAGCWILDCETSSFGWVFFRDRFIIQILRWKYSRKTKGNLDETLRKSRVQVTRGTISKGPYFLPFKKNNTIFSRLSTTQINGHDLTFGGSHPLQCAPLSLLIPQVMSDEHGVDCFVGMIVMALHGLNWIALESQRKYEEWCSSSFSNSITIITRHVHRNHFTKVIRFRKSDTGLHSFFMRCVHQPDSVTAKALSFVVYKFMFTQCSPAPRVHSWKTLVYHRLF